MNRERPPRHDHSGEVGGEHGRYREDGLSVGQQVYVVVRIVDKESEQEASREQIDEELEGERRHPDEGTTGTGPECREDGCDRGGRIEVVGVEEKGVACDQRGEGGQALVTEEGGGVEDDREGPVVWGSVVAGEDQIKCGESQGGREDEGGTADPGNSGDMDRREGEESGRQQGGGRVAGEAAGNPEKEQYDEEIHRESGGVPRSGIETKEVVVEPAPDEKNRTIVAIVIGLEKGGI